MCRFVRARALLFLERPHEALQLLKHPDLEAWAAEQAQRLKIQEGAWVPYYSLVWLCEREAGETQQAERTKFWLRMRTIESQD